MPYFIFVLIMLCAFVPMGIIAINTPWSLFKILLFLLFLPVIIILLFIKGLIKIAYPILVITFVLFVLSRLLRKNENKD